MVCDKAQLQTIIDFWEITCKQGSLTFWRKDDTKPDETLVEYGFLSPPSYEPLDIFWRVTLQLEQLTTFQGTFPLGDGEASIIRDTQTDRDLTT